MTRDLACRRAWLALALAAGCAGSGKPGRAASPDHDWLSRLHRTHPLVGRIWDVRQRRWIGQAALETALSGADFILLGETHDNPDHHLLEARLVRALGSGQRRPAVAFEMLDAQQQPLVDADLARAPRDPDALAEAVGWARSGWPPFSLYRPVFAAALDAGLPVVAANLPRRTAREVVARGPSALRPPVRELLERAGALPEELARALRQEMADAHCGALPESLLDGMVLMQRARDAELAEHLLSAGERRGAVLIAGAGHVRTDRGVPAYVRRAAPERRTLAVAFLEVSPERLDPADDWPDPGSGPLPFDLVQFTPAAEREDPCQELRR